MADQEIEDLMAWHRQLPPERRRQEDDLPGRRNSYGVVDAGKKAKVGDGKVDPGAVKLRIDRLAEFEQIFAEAWRIQRDWFYDQNMHGVDWQAMHDKYQPFVAGCGTRGDLNYLIGEMIAELNIGHTYIFGGDYEDGARQRLAPACWVPIRRPRKTRLLPDRRDRAGCALGRRATVRRWPSPAWASARATT